MSIPTPKFAIGQRVFLGTTNSVTKRWPCPDCLGSGKWTVTTPAGATLEAACLRCGQYSVQDVPSLAYCAYEPSVQALTIGSVRIDTADTNRPVSYMCRETGIGSGSIWDEGRLHETEEAAQADAARRAAEANAGIHEEPKHLEARRLGSMRLRDAAMAAAHDLLWSAAYQYRRLREDIEDAIDESGGSKDELIEALRDKLEWDKNHRDWPPLPKLLAAAHEAVAGNIEPLKKAVSTPELAIFADTRAEP